MPDLPHFPQFVPPPPRKVNCPIVDVHTHSGRNRETARLIEAADIYGITRLVIISRLDEGLAIRKAYPEKVIPAIWLDYDRVEEKEAFIADNLRLLERAADAGVRIVKFWFAPRLFRERHLSFDDERLEPVFAAMGRMGFSALVHIADPDIWFRKYYADRLLYGTKEDQYRPLEHVLAAHRDVNFIAAHLGGDPEHLEHLDALLVAHPNLYLDTSATRWLVRELGRQPEATRDFFARNSDRILFGTDQVALESSEPERYTSRYWIHQMFWETKTVCPLPIDDPDATGEPILRGVNLPADVLEKIYWRNAVRVLQLKLG